MTKAQIKKLHSLSPVLNFYESTGGYLVVDTTHGSKHYARLFIGPRGGFTDQYEVYRRYDFEDKKPYDLLSKFNH